MEPRYEALMDVVRGRMTNRAFAPAEIPRAHVEMILEAARGVFAELGYGAATVRDIIRATTLASGTFYNYFKSKEEIYQAIRDEAARHRSAAGFGS